MKLTFWGAAREVTGSMHLLQANSSQILLDCGLAQGHRAEARERNSNLPFNASAIDYVLLSHAHIDHSGNLPTLVRQGYSGEIICTDGTQDLARLMLRDSAKIQEQDAAYLNKKRAQRGEPLVEPLYRHEDALLASRALSSRGYRFPFNLNRANATATFYNAGHILGSAFIVLESHLDGRALRLGFSGDLGVQDALILRDPDPVPPLDYLILEGTYGDREHPAPSESERELARVVQETTERGGKTVIPCFAIDRTQDIVYSLHRSILDGGVEPVPIFVDSPLAIDATDIYRVHPEQFDEETTEFAERNEDPWGFRQLTYTRDVEASKSINGVQGPAVIISSNGMVEAGRILHHVKHTITEPENTILFVGYQAENTLGRRILDGAKRVRILGDEYPVRARIARVDGFSAHADRSELLDWVRPIADRLKCIFIVHAEEKAAGALARDLQRMGSAKVLVPRRGDRFELD